MTAPAELLRQAAAGIGGALSGVKDGVRASLKVARRTMEPELKALDIDTIFTMDQRGFDRLAIARNKASVRAYVEASNAKQARTAEFYDELERSHAEFTRTLAIPAAIRNPTTEAWTRMTPEQKQEIAMVEKARRIRRQVHLEMMGVKPDPQELVAEGVSMEDVESGVGGGME